MPNEPVKITAQELEGIKKLPSCQFMLGGTPQTGFLIKSTRKFTISIRKETGWLSVRGSRRENRKAPGRGGSGRRER